MPDSAVMTGRGALAIVPEPAREASPSVSFCSHCGARPKTTTDTRVCGSCGLGLLLLAGADVAPSQGGAFVVLDSSLAVCAVSAEAERLLGTSEHGAVNRHVTELIVPADAEAQGPQNLAVAVTWAARGDASERRVTVRPTHVFGVRLNARIAGCGPPQAALLVFDR